MSWLQYKYKNKNRPPAPPWFKWGVLAFFGLAALMSARDNRKITENTEWPSLHLDRYPALIRPSGNAENEEKKEESKEEKKAKPAAKTPVKPTKDETSDDRPED